MKTAKMTKEQLIAEVRESGTSKEAVAKIAEKYGLDVKSVYARISQYKIKELLQKEAAEQIKQVVEEEAKVESPATETPSEVDRPKRGGLKPKSLVGQDTHLEYDLMAEELVILDPGSSDEHRSIQIPWEILESVIEELKEIKEIVEAG